MTLSTNDHHHFDNLINPIKQIFLCSLFHRRIWRWDLPKFMQLGSGRAKIWTQPVSFQSLCCQPSCLLGATDNWWQLENNTGVRSAFFCLKSNISFYSVVLKSIHPCLSSSKASSLVHANNTCHLDCANSPLEVHPPYSPIPTYQFSKQKQSSVLGPCPVLPTSFQITSLHQVKLQPHRKPSLCFWIC